MSPSNQYLPLIKCSQNQHFFVIPYFTPLLKYHTIIIPQTPPKIKFFSTGRKVSFIDYIGFPTEVFVLKITMDFSTRRKVSFIGYIGFPTEVFVLKITMDFSSSR